MPALYTATATATGEGRNGHTRSSDGLIDLDLAVPKEMGGAGGATNPEQLFAAGYAACFHSALKRVAGKEKLDVHESSITARVSLGIDGQAFGLAVTLIGRFPELDDAQGHELMEQAHQVCPYSRATRGNVEVKLEVAPHNLI